LGDKKRCPVISLISLIVRIGQDAVAAAPIAPELEPLEKPTNAPQPIRKPVLCTRGGYVLGYSAQIAVSDDHLIVAQRVIQKNVDNASLVPMVRQAASSPTPASPPTRTLNC
jgi:hypothetical protein